MIIKDQQTILDRKHATVNIKLEYPQIFQYVFMDFLKNSLTRPFFELEKCSFFFKWVRISPEIDWYHYQCCFPDKMSYYPTFLVNIDVFTDRTFCSPTVQYKVLL